MTSEPLVSVITVNWNTARETLGCVNSLLASDHCNLLINVIDNGSSAQDLDVLRKIDHPRVCHWGLDRNYGYVGGVNHGLKMAEKQYPAYILILNNDTEIDPAAVSELVKAAERHNNNCIVTGIVYDFHQRDLVQQVGSVYTNKLKLIFRPVCGNQTDPCFSGEDLELDMIDDVFWLLPAQVFRQVGYYCDHFWFNDEQADYALRAVKAGFKLIATPYARIWHLGSAAIGGRRQNPVRVYFDTKSRLILRYKHLPRSWFVVYYLNALRLLCISWVRHAARPCRDKRGQGKTQLARLLGFWDFTKWLFNQKPDSGKQPIRLRGMNQ